TLIGGRDFPIIFGAGYPVTGCADASYTTNDRRASDGSGSRVSPQPMRCRRQWSPDLSERRQSSHNPYIPLWYHRRSLGTWTWRVSLTDRMVAYAGGGVGEVLPAYPPSRRPYLEMPAYEALCDMNLYRLLARRGEEGRPIRVGLIGAGKFGTMFLAQAGAM